MYFSFFSKIMSFFTLLLLLSFGSFSAGQGFAENTNRQSSSETVQNNNLEELTSVAHSENESSSLLKKNPEIIFQQIWKERFQQLIELSSLSKTIKKNVLQNAQIINALLQEEQKEFSHLLGLHQIAYAQPIEQIVLVYRMKQLYAKVTKTNSPLLQLNVSNNNGLSEINRLKKELSDSEQMDIGLFDKEEGSNYDTLKKYKQKLIDTEKSFSNNSSRIALLLNPASELSVKLGNTMKLIERDLQTVWVTYYATPISFLEIHSDDIFVAMRPKANISTNETSLLDSRLSVPESQPEFIYSGRNFLLCVIVFALVACWAYRKAVILPSQWRIALQRVFKKDWTYITLGSGFIAASSSSLGGIYFSFAFVGSLLFILGIGLLGWRLRSVAKHSLIDKPSPFLQMYLPFVIGVICIYLDIPLGSLGIIWLLLMSYFILHVSFILKKHGNNSLLPMFETFLYKGARVFSILSFITVIAGYPRLAILVFLLFFAVVSVMTLMVSCKGILTLIIEKRFKKSNSPIYNVMAHSLLTPVTLFVIAVISFLPWQWAVPGASNLLWKVISQNYTLGTTSISFTHFLVIVLLFFVFRSIIAIGNKSLSHLPEKISNIEKGVIPPLKTLLTYGAWVVFALISLGLFGISLTSLAVVAGGLSVGIGFGMQNIFNNLVSGLLLIFGRSILVGDTVQVGAITGTVVDISIRSTTIETKELSLLYVPNSVLMSGQFINCTRNSRIVQRSFTLGVGYGTDPALVTQLFFEAVSFQDKIIKNPSPSIRLENFGDNSLDFTITIRIEDLSSASDVLSQLKQDLLRLLTEHSIEIPFPQLDVHLQKVLNAEDTSTAHAHKVE